MIIDLTYHCSMGCTHCLSDCKPDGQHMPYSVFEDVLEFANKYSITVLHFSGGEIFEHPDILKILERIGSFVEQRDKRRVPILPIALITNGRVLANTAKYQEAYIRLRNRIGKNRLLLQVTDDPRFYPTQLNEKEKYRLRKLGAIIDAVPSNPNDPEQCLYPQGRALKNFPDAKWNTNAPKCCNLRLLTKQLHFKNIAELTDILATLQKFCTPTIAPDGGIKLGESALCPSVATIYDSNDEIMRQIQECQCDLCQIPLKRLKMTKPLAYAMLGYNQ